MEHKKVEFLKSTKCEIIDIALIEASRDITNLSNTVKLTETKIINKTGTENFQCINNRINENIFKSVKKTDKRLNKKINFFQNHKTDNTLFTSTKVPSRFTKIQRSKARRVKDNENYKRNVKERKQTYLSNQVTKIKADNVVVNFSDLEVPDLAYVYLSKGLSFVPSAKGDKLDIQFDTHKFCNNLSWKVFWKQNRDAESSTTINEESIHKDLFVNSNTAADIKNPLFDEIKAKLNNWVDNLEIEEPKKNLPKGALIGRKWVNENVKNKNIFITKADKGGSILILNYSDVVSVLEKEILNEEKYAKIVGTNGEQHLKYTSTEVKKLSVKLKNEQKITPSDLTLITGINKNGNMSMKPGYIPVEPSMYPSFKVHKLNREKIDAKVIPPARFINSARNGPLYRMEKWTSPHLTNISKEYTKNEFLLDTNDLLRQIEYINESGLLEDGNTLLFTLDVKELYPSMNPQLVLQSLNDCFFEDNTTPTPTKEALREMVELCLSESYVTYKDECYQSKKGIPTGGCNSRQLADIFLHWLLFYKIDILNDVTWGKLIKLWKRFIDDCLGLWKGTRRQFDMFVNYLNKEAAKFGICFADNNVGLEVNFLDVTLYIKDKKIHYTLYVKPTDARRYLRTSSFHPPHTFDSVPISQIMRVIKRCSTAEEQNKCVEQLKTDLMASGYTQQKLNILEKKSWEIIKSERRKSENNSPLVFSVDYFQEVGELRKLLHDLSEDISFVVGDVSTRVIVACRKRTSIGNSLSANRLICKKDRIAPEPSHSQACGIKRCLTCDLMFEHGETIKINNMDIKLNHNVNCKSSNIIYMLQCTKCPPDSNNSYIGQTRQECHNRMNGHRSSFSPSQDIFENSAVAEHAYTAHDPPLDLADYKCGILERCASPTNLDRSEHRQISKYRTISRGINRCKVSK